MEAMDIHESLTLLKQKYESIINIKTEDQFIINPANLYEI